MNKLRKLIKNKKGFTLIELIVVIAVLGILAAIAVPRFTGVQQNARQEADAATLEVVEKATELYVISENITLPTGTNTISVTTANLITEGYLDSVPPSQVTPANTAITITVDSTGQATATYTTP